ncbi:uncharacterized protein LOC143296663 [Babylonia areolata]|uniref:uncharacterized protein LOC143296663 n=1 Tax=Babylonia areolata TaxID=304850 RepID=UPI003FD1858F
MSTTVVEEEVTLEDLATMCEENQEELADLILQEVPFYTFSKSEPVTQLVGATADNQVTHFLECDVALTTDITAIAQENCCSNNCYNNEMVRSPDSEGSTSNLSSHDQKKCGGGRKIRTPNTLQHMMEKHRHSERKRHHSLNERLKAICHLIPGSALDNRETKVVMMQRVISYIAYLENSIKLLCCQTGSKPHPSWVLLTTNFSAYFHDYFKGIEDADFGDDEVRSATDNLSKSLEETNDVGCYGSRHPKVSSPTVDSTTDRVVPVMAPQVEEEVVVLSQDSGVPGSSLAGEEGDRVGELWGLCDTPQEVGAEGDVVGTEHGDAGVFFRCSLDDGVSAMLEISSSTTEDKPLTLGLGESYRQEDWNPGKESAGPPDQCLPKVWGSSPVLSPVGGSLYTLHRPPPDTAQRRNKRKQLSPRRSTSQDDYLSDKAYLPSWSTAPSRYAMHDSGKDSSPSKVQRILPYNIRCNHRHPVQRLQATGARLGIVPAPTPPPLPRPPPDLDREAAPPPQDKGSTKLDLRKTSWMNGFMMFSRLNRRHFIQAHPGVHTSHISKIMGHAWRNMSKEDQAPYKEKAQLCAKELYRVYTSQPCLSQSSALATSTTDTTTTTTAITTATDSTPTCPPPLSLPSPSQQ